MDPALIDHETFRELQAATGDDFVAELVDTFLGEAPAMFADLRDAAAAGDADRFRRGAHSLKSNSLTFGAALLGALARELELGGLPAATPEALSRLDETFAATARALRDLADG